MLEQNLNGHVKRCPLLKQIQSLSLQPFYRKGINAGCDEEEETCGIDDSRLLTMTVSSEMKRNALHKLSVLEFCNLIEKIESLHESLCKDIQDSSQMPEVCSLWIKSRVEERKIPFQEKHIVQQASILGNLEKFGVLKNTLERKPVEGKEGVPAVIEFGAGRGYLTQMLADCYGIERVFLVERKSYKLKADRSLRQNESLMLERLRIDIEDLDLNAVESLQGVPFLAIGKHLCGAATDLTLRCCFPEHRKDSSEQYTANKFGGLAIATCCHHLCQWSHYTNKRFFLDLGLTKEEFNAITWFTSWAVDATHDSDLPDTTNCRSHLQSIKEQGVAYANGVEKIIADMEADKRAAVGFKCKWIIDMGRLMWLRKYGLEAKLVRYVPPSISPENHLLIARPSN
ncbi:tRNA:m(4)X modification enzyme TRM13 homolog isoform X3 [Abrus precatorius]|uniref:tRNA:m(4)X modification enzyme TRM13 n=1 Tax=Abrus precatorius TaxID=3816 RepID=A0A8B8M0U6_ABRPR|nr:tRNA:m(4)X modification enzyme TRM13 homolog isoform X3 [Abrus precatorius]XP_027361422.1 tRNA:m(4)X modification enzyme TRM13 homolog isoform X3 [Abrus precatorius]